jgi:DNA modification methylase
VPVQIITGDCRHSLKNLDARSVDCCVTSPPYFGLRDYGVDGQIGLEQTPQDFVNEMVAVFREVWRVLRDDGTLWLNLGDSYVSSATGSAGNNSKLIGGKTTQLEATKRPSKTGFGLSSKNLIGIPWRVAFALQADGWCLRQDIIWSKPNPMPESVRDRCTKAHEYIFLLSKSERYRFDQEAILEPISASSVQRLSQDVDRQAGSSRVLGKTNGTMKAVVRPKGNSKTFRGGGSYTKGRSFDNNAEVERDSHGNTPNETGMRNRRSVWTVATQPFKQAHFATFPPALIEPCIKAGCPKGGTVLDPFGGAGTTGLVASRLGRDAILLELSPEYAAMARTRVDEDSPLFA